MLFRSSGDTEQVTERLDRGLLDMAFIVEPPDLSKYNYLEVPEYDTWGVLMRKDNPLAAKEAIAFDDLLDIPIFCSEQSAKMDLPRWCSDNLDRLNILATFNLCNNGAVFVREGLGGSRKEKRELLVGSRDIPLFYARVLEGMEALGILQSPEIDWEKYRPEALKARFEFDSDSPDELRLRPTLSYGDFTFSPLADEHVPREICRDVPAEFYISRLITRYFSYWEDESGELVIRGDEEALYQVLSEGMTQFQEVGEVWLSESVRHLRISTPCRAASRGRISCRCPRSRS